MGAAVREKIIMGDADIVGDIDIKGSANIKRDAKGDDDINGDAKAVMEEDTKGTKRKKRWIGGSKSLIPQINIKV